MWFYNLFYYDKFPGIESESSVSSESDNSSVYSEKNNKIFIVKNDKYIYGFYSSVDLANNRQVSLIDHNTSIIIHNIDTAIDLKL